MEGRRGALGQEARRFLLVGLLATLLTITIFNVLTHAGASPLYETPVLAYWIAYCAGLVVTYVGNDRWTFGARPAAAHVTKVAVFIGVNLVSLGIPTLSLVVSRGLGFDSQLADNVSANVVGLGLATVFRFFAYRRWVFSAAQSAVGLGPDSGFSSTTSPDSE